MQKRLYESEWRVMEILWEGEPMLAREICRVAAEKTGWNKNTTYTVLKKLVEKGVVERREPGFQCAALLKREDARRAETDRLLQRFYRGSKKVLFSALLEEEPMSAEELDELFHLLERKKQR